MLKHVDLCSGIGGFALGFQWAGLSDPVLFCDVDPFCRKVLAKNFPGVALSEDVKELASDAKRLVPDCDVLTAGYPCQPFSLSGKRKGEKDDRHLWPYIRTILEKKRPACCVFENVYGHVGMGLDTVIRDLNDIHYSSQCFVVPASYTGAPHRRDRVWIVAYSDSPFIERRGIPSRVLQKNTIINGAINKSRWQERDCWESEPRVDRVAYGLPSWVDINRRNHTLGNAIVPQIAYRIGLAIRATYELEE
jgi:DNA (cytosine-5)-methyltransferase 1